jgi:hypothetical protein
MRIARPIDPRLTIGRSGCMRRMSSGAIVLGNFVLNACSDLAAQVGSCMAGVASWCPLWCMRRKFVAIGGGRGHAHYLTESYAIGLQFLIESIRNTLFVTVVPAEGRRRGLNGQSDQCVSAQAVRHEPVTLFLVQDRSRTALCLARLVHESADGLQRVHDFRENR